MANSSASNSASGSAGSQDKALADMINGLKEESINSNKAPLIETYSSKMRTDKSFSS